ncbi:MAG: twin-arginine translocase subunit TatC [Alphaproteobacteria bacterium]
MTDTEVEEHKMPLMAHLRELRQRLMWATGAFLIAFAGSLYFADEIYAFLAAPLMEQLKARGQENVSMIFTALWEGFFTQIKVGFFAGICIAFPFIAWQLWLFIAPGLYKREKKAFLPFLIATPFLFAAGASMAYWGIFPLAWDFFLDFQSTGENGEIPTVVAPKISEYLSIVMKMIFAFGLAFELPVLLSLMARAGLVSAKGLATKRKYAIVIIVTVAAIITPPDVFSQVGLSIPLYGLYEVSIWLARRIERQREAREEALYAELRGETASAGADSQAPAPYDDSDTLGVDATDFSLSYGRS